MGLVDVGNNQNGTAADTSYAALNATIQVPPGGYLPVGLPVTRNLLTYQGNYGSKVLNGFVLNPTIGDAFVQLPLGGALAATTGASWSSGVYIGQPTVNPWLNPAAQSLNTSIVQQPGYIAKSGVRPVLAGVVASGTTVKVGDFLIKGATSGTTSLYPFLLSNTGATTTAGITVAQVIATPIWTNLTAGIASGAQTATVLSTAGMVANVSALTINPGQPNQETVTPTAVTQANVSVAQLAVALVAGAASTVQITFNIAGYQGSTGLTGPTGTNTTTFTISVPIANGSTAAQTANAILTALLNSGFCFGAPQNINGIGAGGCAQTSTAGTAGNPYGGPLVYAWISSGTNITLSVANPGIWSTTLLTYTVTNVGGVTQTINGAAVGSATPVAFTGGANGTITGTFQYAHAAGEPVYGLANTSQQVIVPAPTGTGALLASIVLADVIQM